MARNAQRNAAILKRWNAGETGTEIARALGLTTGVVSGVVHRAELEAGNRSPAPPRPQRPRPVNPSGKQYRGFAAMDPERRRAIAAKGGGSVAPGNRSFSRDAALAARAGAKGGASGHSGRKSLEA